MRKSTETLIINLLCFLNIITYFSRYLRKAKLLYDIISNMGLNDQHQSLDNINFHVATEGITDTNYYYYILSI